MTKQEYINVSDFVMVRSTIATLDKLTCTSKEHNKVREHVVKELRNMEDNLYDIVSVSMNI